MEEKAAENKESSIHVILHALRVSIQIRSTFSKVITVLGFVMSLMPILLAKVLQRLTDSAQQLFMGEVGLWSAMKWAIALICLFVIGAVFEYLQNLSRRTDSRLYFLKYLRKRILECKCSVKYKYIENYDDFYEKVNFVEAQAGMQVAECLQNLVGLLQSAITFVSVVYSLCEVGFSIVLILLVTIVPAVILAYKQNDEQYRSATKWMQENNLVLHYYAVCGGDWTMQEIRHYGLFPYLKGRWRHYADIYCAKKKELTQKHVKYNALADFLRSFAFVFVLVLTLMKIYDNPAIGIGTFTLVYSLAIDFQRTTALLFIGVAQLFGQVPYMRAFFYLDELEREPASTEDKMEVKDIEFSHVTFSYPNSQEPALKDISLTIKKGERIAIVGENGSGKTTFINLLCGMFEPDTGQILVNGRDIRDNVREVRNSISAVFQDFAHYEDTLRNNICISNKKREASDEEIYALAERLHTTEVIDSQEHGLNEEIGTFNNTARDLSGGQWQKVSIMRAAYRDDTDIMILDEPTSALDPVAETQLYKDFSDVTGDRTTLLISHRLGITAVVNRILVFKEGRIIEDGTHEELMRNNGFYRQMYQAQAQMYQ